MMDRPIVISRDLLLSIYRCIKGLKTLERDVEMLIEQDRLTRIAKFGTNTDHLK